MSTDIKTGDLVVVVRPTLCCGNASSIGKIGKVLGPAKFRLSRCSYCKKTFEVTEPEVIVGDATYEAVRLKKIDPPALADDTETQHELEAV